MPGEKAAVDEFLEKAGMHPDSIDLDRTVDLFFEEMRRGLEGRESSLEMIPTFIDDVVHSQITSARGPSKLPDTSGTKFAVCLWVK